MPITNENTTTTPATLPTIGAAVATSISATGTFSCDNLFVEYYQRLCSSIVKVQGIRNNFLALCNKFAGVNAAMCTYYTEV